MTLLSLLKFRNVREAPLILAIAIGEAELVLREEDPACAPPGLNYDELGTWVRAVDPERLGRKLDTGDAHDLLRLWVSRARQDGLLERATLGGAAVYMLSPQGRRLVGLPVEE